MGANLNNRANAAGGHAFCNVVHRGCSGGDGCGVAGHPGESKRAGADDRGELNWPTNQHSWVLNSLSNSGTNDLMLPAGVGCLQCQVELSRQEPLNKRGFQ